MDELRHKHNEAMNLAQMAQMAAQQGETEKSEGVVLPGVRSSLSYWHVW